MIDPELRTRDAMVFVREPVRIWERHILRWTLPIPHNQRMSYRAMEFRLDALGFLHRFDPSRPEMNMRDLLVLLARRLRRDGSSFRDEMSLLSHSIPATGSPNAIEVRNLMVFKNIADATYARLLLS